MMTDKHINDNWGHENTIFKAKHHCPMVFIQQLRYTSDETSQYSVK